MAVYKLLTPPNEEAEIYPYRRAWRSIILESAVLFAACAVIFFIFGIFRPQVPQIVNLALNLLLIALPVLLWLLLSVWRERAVPEPRQRLITVFLVTALAANALAVPFIEDVIQPERWLPLGGAINRIIGYAFTIGIVQETTKYAVVRFITWPDYFRTRLDSVAYCAASAIGYSLVLNLRHFLGESTLTPDVMALQVFGNVAVNLAASLIVSYGLAEVHFDKPTPFLMTVTVALAALINGIVIPLRSGLTNASFVLSTGTAEAPSILSTILSLFSPSSSVPKPFLGFAFSGVILLALGIVVAFLYNNAERQAREAEKRED